MENKREIQILYSTLVPMQEPWIYEVRTGNSLHWGSKVIKRVLQNQTLNGFKPSLGMCQPFLGKNMKICIQVANKKAFYLIRYFFIAFATFSLLFGLIFHILAIRKQCDSLLYWSCEGSMYLAEEDVVIFLNYFGNVISDNIQSFVTMRRKLNNQPFPKNCF